VERVAVRSPVFGVTDLCLWAFFLFTVKFSKSHSILPNKNPPAAKCFSEKSTNCKVPFLKTHQLLSVHIAVGGFLDEALCSWWIFRIGSSQSVDFH